MPTRSFQSHSIADPGKGIIFFCLPVPFLHFTEQPCENLFTVCASAFSLPLQQSLQSCPQLILYSNKGWCTDLQRCQSWGRGEVWDGEQGLRLQSMGEKRRPNGAAVSSQG